MPRSNWKGPFIDPSLLINTNKVTRRSTILPQFVNREVQCSNGNQWILLRITKEIIGHKFGEFLSTRRFPDHKKKKKKR